MDNRDKSVLYDIYIRNERNTERYALGKSSNKILLVISLNPNKATNKISDITVSKVEEISMLNGFEGFILFNLCPIRVGIPRLLPKSHKRFSYTKNIKILENYLSKSKKQIIWAAWGTHITDRNYLINSLRDIFSFAQGFEHRWKHFGVLTKDGHPRHPSRVSYSWQFHDFPIASYLRNLNRKLPGSRHY